MASYVNFELIFDKCVRSSRGGYNFLPLEEYALDPQFTLWLDAAIDAVRDCVEYEYEPEMLAALVAREGKLLALLSAQRRWLRAIAWQQRRQLAALYLEWIKRSALHQFLIWVVIPVLLVWRLMLKALRQVLLA